MQGGGWQAVSGSHGRVLQGALPYCTAGLQVGHHVRCDGVPRSGCIRAAHLQVGYPVRVKGGCFLRCVDGNCCPVWQAGCMQHLMQG